jgi:hypothetical protein
MKRPKRKRLVRTLVHMGEVPAGTVAPVLREIRAKKYRIPNPFGSTRAYGQLPARLELDVDGRKLWVYGDEGMVEEL